MKSSIIFRNITCLDHAWIDTQGFIHGRSYHVSAKVTGNVSKSESVVLDFSAGKKKMKALIDDNSLGFDHKLIISPYSKVTITDLGNGLCAIKSSHIEAEVPSDAIQRTFTFNLGVEIRELFKYKMPDLDFEVTLNQDGFTDSKAYFCYSHGLKNSISYGCQNIFHGHTSFVEVTDGVRSFPQLERKIADFFDDAVLISQQNVVSNTHEATGIVVETKSRGKMTATYRECKRMILPTETTIEYMTQQAVETFYNELKGKALTISEGLQKGCTIDVK
jgi:6-pyruvoyl-tetrahydropterin synthase